MTDELRRPQRPDVKVLILWSEAHSTNLGVQALRQGTTALVERVWPAADICYQGFGAGDAPTRLGNRRRLAKDALRRPRELQRWLSSFDVAVDTRAGDSFADIYGLERLTMMSITAEWAHRSGVPLVLGPQTIGPFDTRRGRLIGRRTLHTARAVLVRDSVSAEVAEQLGRRPDALTTDVVFALPMPPVARRFDVLLNVSGLLWTPNPHCDDVAYRAIVTGLVHALRAAGRRVALLAHVLDSPLSDNDVPAANELAREVGGGLEVVVPTSLDDVRSIIAGSELVIGSRMHACLNALSVGVPTVPLAYSRKFAPLLNDLGWPHTVDLRSGTDHVDRVMAAAGSAGLADEAAAVRALAAQRLTLAESVLRAVLP